MPATLPVMQLSDIRLAAQQRADMVNSQFISTAEWNSLTNQSYFELYDLLVERYGDNYYIQTPYSLTTDGVNDHFTLPSDFYKIKGVDLLLAGTPNSSITIRRFNWAERNRFSIPNVQTLWGLTNLMYQLSGSQIWFIPLPAAAQTIRLWYVPRLAPLVNDTDTADGISGWLEYVIVDVALKAIQKEEGDTSSFERQKAALVQRINEAASARDASQPMHVSDNSFSSWGWPFGGGGGNDSGGY